MIRFKKHDKKPLSKHFSSQEFACKCTYPSCQEQLVADTLLIMLEKVREELGGPITITSAFRCNKKQRDLRRSGIQTASSTSSHELGIAVDIQAKDMKKLGELVEKYFSNIGTAPTFYHVDMRPMLNGRKRRWNYV